MGHPQLGFSHRQQGLDSLANRFHSAWCWLLSLNSFCPISRLRNRDLLLQFRAVISPLKTGPRNGLSRNSACFHDGKQLV